MGLKTDTFHIAAAVRFYQAADKYIAIGRTTAWPDENNPPAEDPAATALDEVIGYKPATTRLYKQDPGGSFTYKGVNYTEVTLANAFTQGATFVYCECKIEYDELPLSTFRQYGIYTGLVKAVGAPSGALLPSQVSDPGRLEAYDNRTAVVRTIDKIDVLTFMFSF